MNESNREKISKRISSKKMVQFTLIAPVAGLLSGMWGNIQFYAVHALFIPQILIAIIYLAYSIIDAINDPIIGYMTDRSKKYTAKYGKRYIWILIGVISTPILLILCFIPISTDVIISAIWLVIIMAIFETSLTLHEVSHASLYPDMFREQYQRRKVSLKEFNSWGVINQIVDPPEDLPNAVKNYVKELSRKSLEILALTKNAINTMSTRLANEFYNLEKNYGEYYFAGLKGESRIGLDEFLQKMTKKYTMLK